MRHIPQLSWQTGPLDAAAAAPHGIGTISPAAEEDTETIATKTVTADGTTTTETTTATTDGATDPGREKEIGTETEGDLEGTGTTGVTVPGHATDHLATRARHATPTIPGEGETLMAGMQETGAMGHLDTEMVCVALSQDLTQSRVLTYSKILAEGPHRQDAAAALPRQTCLTEAKVA